VDRHRIGHLADEPANTLGENRMQGVKIAMTALMTLAWAGIAESAPPAPAADDPAMIALATKSGCLRCHAIKAAPQSDAKPIGPDWQDIAIKYKGRKDAAQLLTATVMGGSNPYATHWKGKVSGLTMPPNAVAVSRPDARRLVRWILSPAN
jgi:cytochrome c